MPLGLYRYSQNCSLPLQKQEVAVLASSFFLELFNDGARRQYAHRAMPDSPVARVKTRRRPLRRRRIA
jgi:hypothetical protein